MRRLGKTAGFWTLFMSVGVVLLLQPMTSAQTINPPFNTAWGPTTSGWAPCQGTDHYSMVAPTLGGTFQAWQDTEADGSPSCTSNTAQRIQWEGLHTNVFIPGTTGTYTYKVSVTFEGEGSVYADCNAGSQVYEAWFHISIYTAIWNNSGGGSTLLPNTYDTYTLDTNALSCNYPSLDYQSASFNWDSSPLTVVFTAATNLHMVGSTSYIPRVGVQLETDAAANNGSNGGAVAQMWFDNANNPTEEMTLNYVSFT